MLQAMLRALWIGVICVGVSGMGCKNKPENAPELRSDVTKEAVIGAPGAEPRIKVVRRPNGDLGVISPDGKQVIIVQPDGYQVCEPSGDNLLCGPLTQMSAVCPECRAIPCLCSNPVCESGCKQNLLKATGSGSATPGTP